HRPLPLHPRHRPAPREIATRAIAATRGASGMRQPARSRFTLAARRPRTFALAGLLLSIALPAAAPGAQGSLVEAARRPELAMPDELPKLPDVPYVASPMEVVHAMLEMAKTGKGDVVYDLGCGDGRIVIAAVRDH